MLGRWFAVCNMDLPPFLDVAGAAGSAGVDAGSVEAILKETGRRGRMNRCEYDRVTDIDRRVSIHPCVGNQDMANLQVNPYHTNDQLTRLEADLLWEYAKLSDNLKKARRFLFLGLPAHSLQAGHPHSKRDRVSRHTVSRASASARAQSRLGNDAGKCAQ
jgi:hypothetical protein